jgi:hypothetical protein
VCLTVLAGDVPNIIVDALQMAAKLVGGADACDRDVGRGQ